MSDLIEIVSEGHFMRPETQARYAQLFPVFDAERKRALEARKAAMKEAVGGRRREYAANMRALHGPQWMRVVARGNV